MRQPGRRRVAPSSERYFAGRNDGLKTFCTYERLLGGQRRAGLQRRVLDDLNRRRAELDKEIGRIKTALKEGIPNPRTRSQEIERLEALTRESEQLESRIQQLR